MAKTNSCNILKNDYFNGKHDTVNLFNKEFPKNGYSKKTIITTTYNTNSKLQFETISSFEKNFTNNTKSFLTRSIERPSIVTISKKIETNSKTNPTSTIRTTKLENLNYQSPYKTNILTDRSLNKNNYESPYRSTYFSPISGNISPQILNSKNNNISPKTTNYFNKPLKQERYGNNSSNINFISPVKITSPTTIKLSSPGAKKTPGIALNIKPLNITPLNIENYKAPINTKKQKLGPGKLYIFNHDEFKNPNNEYRQGSKCDVKLLKDTFKKFKVNVTIFENFTVKKIKNQVEKIYKEDLSKSSCIVIAILSHGNRLDRIAANDDSYSINDDILFPILRNKTLEGKPKILIVQACKGDIDLRNYKSDSSQVNTKPIIPDEIYKFYSTSEGFVSYRNETGSIFIKAFCEELEKVGTHKPIREIMESAIKVIKLRTSGQQIPSMCVNNTEPYIFGDYF